MISLSVTGLEWYLCLCQEARKYSSWIFPTGGGKPTGRQVNNVATLIMLVSSRAPSRIFFCNSDFCGHQPQAGGRVGDQGGAAGGPLHRERWVFPPLVGNIAILSSSSYTKHASSLMPYISEKDVSIIDPANDWEEHLVDVFSPSALSSLFELPVLSIFSTMLVDCSFLKQFLCFFFWREVVTKRISYG